MTSVERSRLRARDRLREVARLGLDRELSRPYLQEIVEEAAERLGAPIALVDVLLDEAQIFVAVQGPVPEWLAGAAGTPIEWAFCRPFVSDPAPRAIPDLTADPLWRDNPLVTIDGARAYIGVPLVSRAGHVVGGLCALDVQPRDFAPGSVELLQQLADDVIARLEARADD
ncbi:GAF domain-containing protein [Actinoplanes sp. URMC 104]|uniref:GAF domain-containing protein n=1 Tax=Actinoplanes sp. URMC 104 TaxID=3423409 RepID=UPI003F195193